MEGDRLAAEVRGAIQTDLRKIEAYHEQRISELRAQRKDAEAEVHEREASAVRGCLVTAQAAVNRILLKASGGG